MFDFCRRNFEAFTVPAVPEWRPARSNVNNARKPSRLPGVILYIHGIWIEEGILGKPAFFRWGSEERERRSSEARVLTDLCQACKFRTVSPVTTSTGVRTFTGRQFPLPSCHSICITVASAIASMWVSMEVMRGLTRL